MLDPHPVRIAIVQCLNGKVFCCGPEDIGDYCDQMDAAMCFAFEAGETPANRYWATVNLPPPALTEIDVEAEYASYDPEIRNHA